MSHSQLSSNTNEQIVRNTILQHYASGEEFTSLHIHQKCNKTLTTSDINRVLYRLHKGGELDFHQPDPNKKPFFKVKLKQQEQQPSYVTSIPPPLPPFPSHWQNGH